jgi:cobalt-precorrin-7 (C5)-methyltransferase
VKPQAYIIGVGPGSSEFLSERARDRLRRSKVVLGWDLDLLPARDLLTGKEVYLQDVRNYRETAKEVAEKFRDTDAAVAILRVGDPCISSGLTGLLELFAGYDIEVVPGVSSVQVAASLARINIDDAVVITFHESGDIEERKRFMLEALHRGRHLLMLAGEEFRPDAAARYLVEHGIDQSLPVLICERLTLPDQSLTWTTLGGLREIKPYWLTVIAVIQPMSTLQISQGGHHADSVAAS